MWELPNTLVSIWYYVKSMPETLINLGWSWYVWFHGGRVHHCWHHNHSFHAPPMMIPSLWTKMLSVVTLQAQWSRDLWDLVYPSLFNNNTKFHKDCMGTAYDLLTLKRNCVHFIICICYIELRSCMYVQWWN